MTEGICWEMGESRVQIDIVPGNTKKERGRRGFGPMRRIRYLCPGQKTAEGNCVMQGLSLANKYMAFFHSKIFKIVLK